MTVSKRAADLGGVDPGRDSSVHEARAVEVEAQVELECDGVQVADLLEGPDPAAARVVRVLDPEHPRARRVDRRDAIGSAHLLGAEAACDARQAARDDSGVNGRAAELGEEDVTVLLADELVAGLGVQAQRDLVRHRRGREEDRLLLPEQPRRTLLELVDRRVLALLLVADDRRGDRGAHPGGGTRGRVGTKVDHRREATLNAWI